MISEIIQINSRDHRSEDERSSFANKAIMDDTQKIFKQEELILNILWIDSEKSARNIGFNLLKALGYNVSTAKSGSEALKILNSQEIDFLIIDLENQILDRIYFILFVKFFFPKIETLVLSNCSIQISNHFRKRLKIDYIIANPINLAQLESILVNILRNISIERLKS